MTQHDPRRARPTWGATSTCTRCDRRITWSGAWVNLDGSSLCEQDRKWGHHRSATAGVPPVSQNAAASEGPHPLIQGILEAHGAPPPRPDIFDELAHDEGLFRDHACWKCRDGATPCVQGHPRQCEYPRARND